MGMKLKIGEREEALGYKGGFRFEDTAEGIGLREPDVHFSGSLSVEGTLENLGGPLRIAGEIRAVRVFVCDRCLLEAEVPERYPFAEDFSRADETSDEEENRFGEDGIDLAPLVRDTVLAALPIRNLCRPDCKGLCPKCGKDLNQGDCGCDREAVDLRLEVLKNLLHDEPDRS